MQNLITTTVAAKNKAVLGMSGGVDSTASAFLLKKQGFEVHGLYFDVFGNNTEGFAKAESAARRLDIPIKYVDISKDFRREIIAYFYNEYVAGRTPNPCVMCNKAIKFRVLLDEADRIGAYYVATGHYARISEPDSETGNRFALMSANRRKDQSYVLWRLNQDELRRIVFPLSEFSDKDEVRELLRAEGFECAEDKDSQEICFIENNDYVSYLTDRMKLAPAEGDFVDDAGRVLGRHKGIIRYTIGQRKGLGITFGKPTFVTGIDAGTNRIILGDNEALFKRELVSTMNNFAEESDAHAGAAHMRELTSGRRLMAKIRYAAPLSACTVKLLEDGSVLTVFDEPQRAVTPGQSVVWYEGERLVGGGIIK